MSEYRISPSKGAQERSAALKRTGYITGVSVLVGILLGGRIVISNGGLRSPAIWLLFGGVFITFVFWRALSKTQRFLADAYTTFQITDDGHTITKEQKDTPIVSLPRSDITRIEEFSGKGFRICTPDHVRNIWVPCELDGYEGLKQQLLALPDVSFKLQAYSWLKSYLTIGAFLVIFAVSIIVKDKLVVVGASVLLASYLLFNFVRHFRNPNLTARGRRQFWWSAFVGVCFLIRAIVVWRS